DPVHHPRAGPAALDPGVFEEGEIGAGAAVLIGIEKVVDGRVVLVDRLLDQPQRSEEHTSELQSHLNLVCRLLLEKKKKIKSNKEPSKQKHKPNTHARAT